MLQCRPINLANCLGTLSKSLVFESAYDMYKLVNPIVVQNRNLSAFHTFRCVLPPSTYLNYRLFPPPIVTKNDLMKVAVGYPADIPHISHQRVVRVLFRTRVQRGMETSRQVHQIAAGENKISCDVLTWAAFDIFFLVFD